MSGSRESHGPWHHYQQHQHHMYMGEGGGRDLRCKHSLSMSLYGVVYMKDVYVFSAAEGDLFTDGGNINHL